MGSNEDLPDEKMTGYLHNSFKNPGDERAPTGGLSDA
jgi:hypothetical protein